MEEVKRLTNSRRGYRSHLKRFFATAGEILERGNTDNTATLKTTLTDLIEQLQMKRSILVELDKHLRWHRWWRFGNWDTRVRGNTSWDFLYWGTGKTSYAKALSANPLFSPAVTFTRDQWVTITFEHPTKPGLRRLCLSRQAVREALTMTQLHTTLHRNHAPNPLQRSMEAHRTSDASNTYWTTWPGPWDQ